MNRSAFHRFPKKAKAPSEGRRALEDMKHGELEHLLDAEVSLWVRGKPAVELDLGGLIPCYTCGRMSHYKSMDSGHFFVRAHRGTRWDLRNIRPQCKRCNWTLEGNKDEYTSRLTAELGPETIEELRTLSAFYGATRMPREWLIQQIRSWRAKNAPLRKELKCLE